MKAGRARRRMNRAWRERGYALVALLAGLTIMLVLMARSIPAFQHEIQREREEEMFWRGQQVSWALLRASRTVGRLPNKLEELTEKVQTPAGEMRFLRTSALCDPMFKCPNEESEGGAGTSTWRAVRRGDPLIRTFYQAYVAAKNKDAQSGLNRLPPVPQDLAQLAATQGNVILPGAEPGRQEGPRDSEFASDLKTEQGPIYGVVSRYDKELIRNYFEIATYDEALFFTGVTVAVPGLINPIASIISASGGGSRGPDPRCPNGGMWFEQDGKGFCAGTINPGQLCRDANGNTVPCASLPK